MEIIALQYNMVEILIVLGAFIAGLVIAFVMQKKWGWVFVVGAAIYGWLNIIQPLINSR